MPIYLAEVLTVSRLTNKVKVLILGIKRPDGLWASTLESALTLYGVRDLNVAQLVIVEMDKDDNLLSITGARNELKKALSHFTVKLVRFDSDKAEIALTKESLEYQSAELYSRTIAIARRDEAQRQQEKKLALLVELANAKIAAANRQHAALTKAWEDFNEQETRLKRSYPNAFNSSST